MKLCVFCGASTGKSPAYRLAAIELGHAMADAGIGLVYGGASVGLMGAVADAVLERGGEVIGVIPRFLADKELAHKKLTRLHVVAWPTASSPCPAVWAHWKNCSRSGPGGSWDTTRNPAPCWMWAVSTPA